MMAERTAPADRRRRSRRSLLTVLIAALLTFGLSGCVIFKSTTATQVETFGKVQITTTFCASDGDSNNAGYNPADTACQGAGKDGNFPGAAVNTTVQLKVAYRIPTTATAPANFTSTNTSNPPTTACGGGITFTENASYSSALTTRSPPGAGKKWVGYLSPAQSYTTAGCQYVTVAPQFTLQQGANNAPFQGPFDYRAVVGFRQVNESQPGNTSARTVTCGSGAITAGYRDGVDTNPANGELDMTGICADDPTAAVISGADLSRNTRDLGVMPTSASANAGSTAIVPFTLRYAGAGCFCGADLTASTNIPGATATPDSAWVEFGDSDFDTPVNVSVPIPANTPAGTYNVTVTATMVPGPQVRQGTATLTVGEAFGFNTGPDVPSLPAVTLNGQAQTKTAAMSNFSVIDSPGSSDQGWNVTMVGATGTPATDRIFWPNAGGNKISSANLSGGGGADLNTTGATVNFPTGTAIDPAAGRIYWASRDANKISYASLNGSGGADLNTTGATVAAPWGVAIDPAAGRVYWANCNGNKISYANLNGGGGGDLSTTGATVSCPVGIAIDQAAGKIYWANYSANKISSANLSGGGGADLTTTGATVSTPYGVALDPAGGKIYWANGCANKISSANISGGGGADLTTTGATVNCPFGVAIDQVAGKIYWANGGGANKISSASLSGGGGADLNTTGATVSTPALPALAAGKAPVFKQYCPNSNGCGGHPFGYVTSGYTLPANSLTLNTTGANWTGGTGTAPTFSCNSGCSVDRATTIKIASAPNGGGTALWTTNNFSSSSLSLVAPSTLRALPASEQYRADVVWTLGSGP